MGASHGDFVKYPRTPHLFGSKGTDDDKHLGDAESTRFLADDSLIVEEKIDGTNVGIHFSAAGELVLQCRGHLITEGMHPQYDLFKQWAAVKCDVWRAAGRPLHLVRRMALRPALGLLPPVAALLLRVRHLRQAARAFLDLERRLALLAGAGIPTVPVVHTGPLRRERLESLIGPSRFDSRFEDPTTGRSDNRMEGLYLRTEAGGVVTGRAKFVRPEFVEKVKQSTHWQHQAMTPNLLADGADIWS